MIYFMRHGEDVKGYVGGWSDIPLTKKGRKKVIETAYWIKNNLKINKIISSDIKRAIETAEIVKDILGIDFELCNVLREQNKGTLTGKLSETLTIEEKNMLDFQEIDTLFPNGETLEEFHKRIKDNWDFFTNLEDNTLIITHRGVINSFYYIINDIKLDMNKKQFNVDFSSLHEADLKNNYINRIN